MEISYLIEKYPQIYHIAEKRNWKSICEHGLLSTTALLDLYQVSGKERDSIESQLRVKECNISHPKHGLAIIRDQDPMRDRPSGGILLDECLVGITPQEWFELLNKKTFFWTGEFGLLNMLGAVLYRNRTHYVFTIDTESLTTQYTDKVTLSAINSGSLYGCKKRDKNTFKAIDRFQEPWVNELAVEYGVPDILDHTISVEECRIQGTYNNRNIRKIEKIWP